MHAQPENRTREERLKLVERICNSRHLAKSPRLREFLLFVTQRSCENRAAEITEFEIARAVFHRGGDFVATEDSVVRGAARQLRVKLKEYFDEDGQHEPWRIEIPKGSYVPVFHEQTKTKMVRSPWPISFRTSLALNILLVAVCVLLGSARWGTNPSHREVSLISAFLRDSPGGMSLIVSDFSQAVMRYMARKPLSLDDYARHDYHEVEPEAGNLYQQRLFELLKTHHLTRSGDLLIATRILGIATHPSNIRVRHARDVTAREVRHGSLIILGNPNSTPWSALFESRLGYHWVQGRGYRDVLEGGREYFSSDSAFHERGTGYARLALLPNFDGSGQVLLISGVNMVTMEAAGEFALDPTAWRQIREALDSPDGTELPHFEALLRTDAVENTPVHAQLVRARRLGRSGRLLTLQFGQVSHEARRLKTTPDSSCWKLPGQG